MLVLKAYAHESSFSGSVAKGPIELVGIVLMVLLFLQGLRRANKQSYFSLQSLALLFGVGILLVAFYSRVDLLSDKLASAHMVQHLLIMLVAAPLITYGFSPGLALVLLPISTRRKIVRAYLRIGWNRLVWTTWLGFALILWIWHLPQMYDLALKQEWIHHVQHLSFFLISCLLWRILFGALAAFRPIAIVPLFLTTLHSMVLGVFLTLSSRLLYQGYQTKGAELGLSALDDQQLAGVLMWMPASFSYIVLCCWLAWNWLARK